ncbi:MAG: HU family DNA-binding protein [Prevotella sp.]|jgi:nucleoid DNA-binding protein|nr:HU family DNA-binding protein [Prevotella sp.]MBR6997814.1 HU family DNA-binding protein [Prevotella sp.]
MNNKEFMAELAKKNNIAAAEAQRMVNALIAAMGDNFMEGNGVQLPNFGTFEVKKKMERVMVNPSTGQRMLVPPKLTLAFKPTATTKDRIKKGGDDNG